MADAQQIARHSAVIDQLLRSAATTSLVVIRSIERAVVALIEDGADTGVIHNEILNQWRNWSQTTVDSLQLSAADTILLHEEMLLSPPGATDQDRAVTQQLQRSVFDQLQQPAQSAAQDIVNSLIVGGVVGIATAELAQRAAIRISGYLSDVTNPLLTNIQQDYTRAIRQGRFELAAQHMIKLRAAWGTANIGPSLFAQSGVVMHDGIMDFDSVFAQWRGTSLGVTQWRYSGTASANTRDFCAAHVGQVFDAESARKLWASQTWSGKRSGDAFVVRGGYNCRHYWTPVDKNIVGNLTRLQQ